MMEDLSKDYGQKKATEAMDRQIPLPLRHKYNDGTGVCERCGFIVNHTEHNYCAFCGQKFIK